jgi:N-acyl-D-amino-acid deacylase
VAVAGGRVAAVGDAVARGGARRTLDAEGLVLAPGLIDLHSHADFTLPSHPGALNSLMQGVTTEVVGNCGHTPAPLSADPSRAAAQRAASHGLGPGLDWSWRTFGEFLDRLDAAHPAVNVAPLVGHGAVRAAVVGPEDRAATAEELAAMRGEVSGALAAGAWGLSSGLVYPPGSFAAPDELPAIAAPLRAVDALYASHIRNEGDALLEAVDEAIGIGRALGVRVEISHLKAIGRRNRGRVVDAIALIGAARGAGVRVTADAYPYTAGATFLSQVLPPWVHDGGADELVARLRSADVRARLAHEIAQGVPGWPNYVEAATGGWAGIRIAAVVDPSSRPLEGAIVADLAARAGLTPLDLVLDVLVRDRAGTLMTIEIMDIADVETVFRAPFVAVGSDQLGVTGPDARVHPRAYGTFARLLGPWVRRGVLDLPTAVHRATGLAASIVGLRDRGVVEPGRVADLVLFDPADLTDRSSDERPTRLAAGVHVVLLGGRFAVADGRPVDVGLGRVLRPPWSTGPTDRA